MDEEALRQHVANLVRAKEETQVGLARVVGIDPTAFSKWVHGKRQFSAQEADELRRYFGIKSEPEESRPHMLPHLGRVPAGRWQEALEDVKGYIPSPDPRLSKDAFVLTVEGGSMNKKVQDGNQVIVDPADRELRAGGFYIIRNAHGDTTFKQYCENPARLEPCTTEDGHRSIFPGQEEFSIVGRVRKRIEDL